MSETTKAQIVERQLRQAISSGRWASGQALPPERDLLRQLNVSRATLRDALNTLSTSGLIVRKRGSGTYVNGSNAVGVVAILTRSEFLVQSIGHFYMSVIDHVREEIEADDYRAIASITHGRRLDQVISSIQLFDQPGVDNLIGVFDLVLDSRALVPRLSELGVPIVAVETSRPGPGVTVVLDYHRMTEMAAETLRDHGCDDFAIMHLGEPEDPEAERKGFSEMRLAAVDNREDRLVSVPRSEDYHAAYDVFKDWWASKDRPNALFFFDDILCDVASRAILELGIKVPEELSIITHSNVGRRFQFPVPITRVEFDPAEVAKVGWNMLRMLILGETLEASANYVAPRLNEGESLR